MGWIDTLLGRDRLDIPAVHPNDLEPFLKSIEKYEPILNGNINCSICGREITLDNIGKICPQKDPGKISEQPQIKIRCDNHCCLIGVEPPPVEAEAPEQTDTDDGTDEQDDEEETEEDTNIEESEETEASDTVKNP